MDNPAIKLILQLLTGALVAAAAGGGTGYLTGETKASNDWVFQLHERVVRLEEWRKIAEEGR